MAEKLLELNEQAAKVQLARAMLHLLELAEHKAKRDVIKARFELINECDKLTRIQNKACDTNG